jgi:hypothetical protein
MNPTSKIDFIPDRENVNTNKKVNKIDFIPSEKNEGALSSASRYASQLGQGVASKWTWGWDLANDLASKGLFGSPEDALSYIHSVQMRSADPKDLESERQKVSQAQEELSKTVPTIRNVSKYIEEKTGLPLEAKTPGQRAIGTLGMLGSMSPGPLLEKGIKATVGAGTQLGAEGLGVDPGLAGIVGVLTGSGKELFELAKMGYGKFQEGFESLLNKTLGEKPVLDKKTPGISLEGRISKEHKDLNKTLPVSFEENKSTVDLKQRIKPIAQGKDEFAHKEQLGSAIQEQEQLNNIIKAQSEIKFEPTKENETLGLTKESPKEDIRISPVKFKNSRESGIQTKAAIMSAEEKDYRVVNENYEKAKKSDSSEGRDRTDLLSTLEKVKEKFISIPHPDPAQQGVIKAIDDIQSSWSGKAVSNQEIVDQVQSLRSLLRYSFEHGDAKNVYKTIISPMLEELERTSSPYSRRLLKEANQSYSDWANLYDSDPFIISLRNKGNTNFSKISEQSLDIDNISKLKKILSPSEYGPKISKALTQEFIDKRLEPLLKEGVIKDPLKFSTEVNEIRSTLDKEEKKLFDNQVKQTIDRSNSIQRQSELEKINKENAKIKESEENIYRGAKPETIANEIHTVSGLKKAQNYLNKTPEGKKLVERVNRYVASNILESDTLENVFRDREKVGLLVTSLGNEVTNNIKKVAQLSENSKSWFRRLGEVEKNKQEISKLLEKEIERKLKFKAKATEEEIKAYEELKEELGRGFWKSLEEAQTFTNAIYRAVRFPFKLHKISKLSKTIERIPGQSPDEMNQRQIEQVYKALVPVIAKSLEPA